MSSNASRKPSRGKEAVAARERARAVAEARHAAIELALGAVPHELSGRGDEPSRSELASERDEGGSERSPAAAGSSHGGGADADGGGRRTGERSDQPSMGPAQSGPSPHAASIDFLVAEARKSEGALAEVPGRDARQVRSTLSGRLKRILSLDGGKHADEIAWALVDRAKGTSKVANDALRIILDRTEGPVVKRLETKGELHHRKTIVVKASEELLERAGDDARLIDVELPADPVPDGEVLELAEEAGDGASDS